MSNPSLTLQPHLLAARNVRTGQAAQSAQTVRGQTVQGGQDASTRAAIGRAAQRTGVDFSYLLAQAQIESGMDPDANSRTSSAAGLFQFIDQTWLATMDRHGAQLGYGELAQAIDTVGGRAQVSDPAMRNAIMGLRNDPQAAALMAGALANDNRTALMPTLGREPDASELYMAHFLGADGANRFLTSLANTPDSPAASILPGAARANRAIFYTSSGAPRSVSAVMDLMRGKVAAAMQSGQADQFGALPDFDNAAFSNPGWYPVQDAAMPSGNRRVSALPALPSLPSMASLPAGSARPSMAETLRSSFALASEGAAPSARAAAHINTAYAKLEAFGL